jgi:hypothetical protein
MNKDNWVKTYEGRIYTNSDANDFYYEWVDFEGELSLTDILEKWLGIGYDGKKAVIKVFKGAVFIQVVENVE